VNLSCWIECWCRHPGHLPKYVKDFRAIADRFNQDEGRKQSNLLVQPAQIQNWFKNRLQKEKRLSSSEGDSPAKAKPSEWLTVPTGFRFYPKERQFLEHIYKTRNHMTPKGTECDAITDAFNKAEPRLSSAGNIQRKQIQQWFMNRRKRDKKEMLQNASEEQLKMLGANEAIEQPPALAAAEYAAWKSIQEGVALEEPVVAAPHGSDLSKLLKEHFPSSPESPSVRLLGQVIEPDKAPST